MIDTEFMATQSKERGKWDMGVGETRDFNHICDVSFI